MSKKIISVILALIFILCASATNCIAVNTSNVYIALGDSITTGYGLENTEGSFVNTVASSLGYEAKNCAVNGATATDVLNLLHTGTLEDDIKSAQLITLTIGGNDMMAVLYKAVADKFNETASEAIEPSEVIWVLQNAEDERRLNLAAKVLSVLNGNGSDIPAFSESEAFETALGIYKENLLGIVSYIRDINADARLVVATQYNPYKNFSGLLMSLSTGVNKGISRLNEVIVSCSDGENFVVADVCGAFEEDELNLCNADSASMNFDFHPNADGHNKIAKTIISSLSDDEENSDADTSEWQNPFDDVSENDWFYESVKYVNQNNLINGIESNVFAPSAMLSRAMLVTVLYRLEGMPEVRGECRFADVVSGSYYEKAVVWAEQSGIVNGYSDSEFRPYYDITREQIASIMFRYAKFKEVAPEGAWAIRLDYADLADVSDYAAEGVMYCTMKNIMGGREGNLFAPKANATRAEFAKVLMNFSK